MILAPHPDDEALACGIILQRALQMGIAVRIVYITDGDNNPWPQHILEKKWRLKQSDRRRWGKLRRKEAVAALRTLGLRHDSAVFLGLPDQGMTDVLLRERDWMVTRLSRLVRDWNPTDILAPSQFDTHPDHSAVGVLSHFVRERESCPIRHWSYLVHGKSPAFFESAIPLPQSDAERAIKRGAIRCHRTQTRLSRRRFLGYAARPERLGRDEGKGAPADGAIRSITRDGPTVRIVLRLKMKPWYAPGHRLLLIGRDPGGNSCSLRIPIPARSGHVEVTDLADGECRGLARYAGHAFAGEMTVPTNSLFSFETLFVKLDRSSWFFDEAGWLEVPAAAPLFDISVPELSRLAAAAGIR
jgi:LmbE family N-acetylglucosaminyl deacetylase